MEPSAEGDSPQGNEKPSEPAPKRAKPTSEATFTPTAAGLHPRKTQEPEITPQMRLIISQAIAQGIAAGIQQKQQATSDNALHQGQPTAPNDPRDLTALQRPHSSASSIHSQKSLWDDEEQTEPVASEVKGAAPDRPVFTGLFNHALFKTLLYKAKATAGIGADPAASDTSLGLSDPSSLVFSEFVTKQDEIPMPKLFLDVVQQEWALLGPQPTLSEMDRRLYNVDPNLTAALEIPKVDSPMVALASPNFISGSTDHALGTEDRRIEVTLRRPHVAAAWAVKTSLAASFFNRTFLLWLREMQARIPATDLRTHQDIKMLVAAAEYSAEATLTSAKFASRALASTVTARRLLWLRRWKVDPNYKWKLATSPYKGGKLFGEVLEPLLVETKDKRKVLPTSSRRSPYFQNPPFRAVDSSDDFSEAQGACFQEQDGQSEWPGYRGRGGQQFQSNRPFRGKGKRPFHRSSK
ncbi:uncharacterized protein [Erythrolamprus reginae]|uniref:uncharacterized protein n=1 Tax=Erythrolamprus reginae TaxID=121349 RepID=UPI00396CB6F6